MACVASCANTNFWQIFKVYIFFSWTLKRWSRLKAIYGPYPCTNKTNDETYLPNEKIISPVPFITLSYICSPSTYDLQWETSKLGQITLILYLPLIIKLKL